MRRNLVYAWRMVCRPILKQRRTPANGAAGYNGFRSIAIPDNVADMTGIIHRHRLCAPLSLATCRELAQCGEYHLYGRRDVLLAIGEPGAKRHAESGNGESREEIRGQIVP